MLKRYCMENINLSRVLIDNDNPSICCNDEFMQKMQIMSKDLS